jgi:hypothetical protein
MQGHKPITSDNDSFREYILDARVSRQQRQVPLKVRTEPTVERAGYQGCAVLHCAATVRAVFRLYN